MLTSLRCRRCGMAMWWSVVNGYYGRSAGYARVRCSLIHPRHKV